MASLWGTDDKHGRGPPLGFASPSETDNVLLNVKFSFEGFQMCLCNSGTFLPFSYYKQCGKEIELERYCAGTCDLSYL